jgi:hypothetical protein
MCIRDSFVRDQFVTADTNNPNDISNLVANKILRQYQDPRDTDQDGRKDWEEMLQGTNLNGTDTDETASSTKNGSFEPKTLTEKFAVEFFDSFIRARKNNTPLTPEEQQALVEHTARKFASENTNKLYTKGDIEIVASGGGALYTYANAVGALVAKNNPEKPLENEALLLKRAIDADDPALLSDLSIISGAYENVVADMLKLPVPEEVVAEHLKLLGAFTAIHDDVSGMELVFTDPMLSYIRVKRYQDDVDGLAGAIEGMRRALEEKKLVFDKSDAGSFFFSLHP